METIQGGGETPTRASSAGAGGGVPLPTAPPFVQEETRPRRRRLIAILVIPAVAALSGGLTHLVTQPDTTGSATSGRTSIATLQTTAVGSPTSVAEMLRRVLPSVVNVRVTQSVEDPFFGSRRGQTAEASGVVLSEDGVILTNSHVVENASSVEVGFTDGHDPMTAIVLGTNPSHDLAVIKVDARDLTPITVGNSDGLGIGDRVYAIGFPLDLGPTVTEGIVSGADRTIDVQDGTGIRHLTGLLQTDAAINRGNSGGALVNSAGELMGIPTAAAEASSVENVGFAIASNTAVAAARQWAV